MGRYDEDDYNGAMFGDNGGRRGRRGKPKKPEKKPESSSGGNFLMNFLRQLF